MEKNLGFRIAIAILRDVRRLCFGALAVALVTPLCLAFQAGITLTVQDKAGGALAGASAEDATGHHLGYTNANGQIIVQCNIPCFVRISAVGYAEDELLLSSERIIRLEPAPSKEEVMVTAYRTPLGSLESPTASHLLPQTALESNAAITLDGQLRQLSGVELFRRSSSLVANPSSQGVSLRGLGSTSASRTLVSEDDIPLNDVVGGWIHWEEQPELSIKSIEVARGGASDLYGSSAIGGVIGLIAAQPTSDLAELRTSYGMEGTYDDSLRLQTNRGPWGVIASGGVLGTDGYVQEAPWQRGPVDINSNVHSQNGLILFEHVSDSLRIIFRGSGFNESRSNGTPDQTNGTRLWRYATGGDWRGPHSGSLVTRIYGSTEDYRQTFSNIANPTTLRNSETLTKFSLIPDNEIGAVIHWSQPLGAGLLVVAGADVHDVRVWDREQTFGSPPALTNLHDHQRDSAVYAELMWVHFAWTVTASSRMDWFQNYDGQQLSLTGSSWVPSASQPPQFDQRVFDPRLGLSRKLWNHWAISGSGFRAFRAPTPNELYRSTQVGSQLTLPNGTLLSERATGWESGLATEWRWGTIRSSYFLTQVNRPITAVPINATKSQRENLGQIESRGVSLDFTLAPRRWLAVDGGYQYAHATVTKYSIEKSLIGNWIPEVARNMATLNARAYRQRIGTLNLQGRLSGRQFDDAANTALIHGYFRLDAYASHDFDKRYQLFVAGENLLNRQIEVSKTPTTTLSTPRVARVGFQLRFGNE